LADEASVKDRLETHLISYKQLSQAHYGDLTGEALKQRLEADFNEFMRTRAMLVEKAAQALAAGNQPNTQSIWQQQEAAA
jgi:superoxide dismutase